MESAKLCLVLSLSFVGGIVYMAATRDLSPRTLGIVGFLGFASLFLGFLIGREDPNALVHVLMVVCTTVAIFAAVFWWYSRDQIAAVVALVAAPPAVVLSALTLRWRADQRDASLRGAMRIASLGHWIFAATLITLGIMGLIKGDFDPTWPSVAKGVPAREVLAYLCSLVYLLCGMGLLWRRTAAVASRLLLAYLLGWLLLVRVPQIFLLHPTLLAAWGFGQTAVIVASAWVLYVSFAGDRDGQRLGFATGDNGLRIARALYGVALIPFGLAHFFFLKETVVLVPGWLPSPAAWAYFTGGAFIVAGLAVLSGVYARLAAALSALQLGTFLLLVWVPRVAAGSVNAFQWGEFVVTVALTASAWVVADSYRGMPWLALGKRPK